MTDKKPGKKKPGGDAKAGRHSALGGVKKKPMPKTRKPRDLSKPIHNRPPIREMVIGMAKIAITEHQIAMYLGMDVEDLVREYGRDIDEHLPEDWLKLRLRRLRRTIVDEDKIAFDYHFKIKPSLTPQKKLLRSVRACVCHHIKKQGARKTVGFKSRLGYTVDELAGHLEALFAPGMTWENYGSYWHVDHVRPASWFTYETDQDEQFKACWALSNLQPLTAIENVRKKDRWEG